MNIRLCESRGVLTLESESVPKFVFFPLFTLAPENESLPPHVSAVSVIVHTGSRKLKCFL